MKNKYYFLIVLLFLVSNAIFAQAPTTASTNLQFNTIDGNRINYQFTKGDGARRIVIAKEGSAVTAVPVDGVDYTHSTTFGSGEEIASGEYVVYDGIGSSSPILGLTPATTYFIKVFEYNGSGFTTEYLTSSFLEGGQATLSPPTTQASAILFSDVLGTSMTVSWTNGDGSSRILIIRENGTVDTEPVDLTSYSASAGGFGSAIFEIGTSNYVVYGGAGSSVNIRNLNPNTTYHFALFEYNGSIGRLYFRPGATASQLTATSPTLNATNLNFSSIDGNRFNYQFTKGNGARRIVIAKEGSAVTAIPADGTDYTHSTTFGNGDEITTGEFVVYDGTGSSSPISGLTPATTYYIKVFEYNGTGANTFYLTGNDSNTNPPLEGSQVTLSPPTTQASAMLFSDVLGSSMTASWTNGNGVGRILIIRENDAVDTEPVDLTTYNQNAGGFGNAVFEIGTGNYVVYGGAGSSVNIRNLNPNTTYHFALFEYNGNNGRLYLRPGATASQATAPFPTLNATNLNFSSIDGNRFSYQFTKGNGARRIVVAKEGSAVTAIPADGTDYTHSTTFGNGDEITTGEFVVYDGTGSSSPISGLTPATTYYIKVFEYNGTGANTTYLIGNDSTSKPPLEGNQATLSPPTTQASAILFSDVLGSSMTASWTNGNGVGRILIIRENDAVDTEPADLTTYNQNGGGFGNPIYEIGTGNYIVYSDTGSSVNLTNLNPDTTYHFALFEYNGNNGRLYLRPGATASQATAPFPTLNATNLNFSSIDGNRFSYQFTKGNGARRIVVAKEGSAVTAIPADGTDYTHSTTFGNGDEITTGEFVVYDGTGSSSPISGLTPATTYYIKVFEYNGTGANTFYLTGNDSNTNPPLEGNQATLTTPTVQASNISFSNILATSMTVSWTNGDGSGRMLIIRENNPVDTDPTDLTTYSASAGGFGNPTYEIGTDNYIVYSNTGSSVNLTNIDTNTSYQFALFEYNGSNGKVFLRPGATTSTLDVDTFNNSIGVKSWPNPSDSSFNIKVETSNQFDKIEIIVYDVSNKTVHHNKFEPGEEYVFGKELEGGVYIVKLIQAGKIQAVRVVKY